MTLVFCSSGESRVLDLFLNKVTPEDYLMRLYVNSWLPTKPTVLGDLTEASAGGYAAGVMPFPTSWSVVASNAQGLAEAVYPQLSWMFTASIGNIHGYYFVGTVSGRLIYAEKFNDGPYAIVRSGDVINITPRVLVNSI